MTFYEALAGELRVFKKKAHVYRTDAQMYLFYLHCTEHCEKQMKEISVEEAQLEVDERNFAK